MIEKERQPVKSPLSDDVLLTMYEQTGEEYRLRHQLLHNLYYLLIVAVILVAGSFPDLVTSTRLPIWLFFLVLAPLFILLGLVTIKHYVDRRSASSVRTIVEQMAEGNHENNLDRQLRIQHDIIGRNTKLDENYNLVEAGPTTKPLFDVHPVLSAKTVAQLMVLIGLSLLIAGLGILIF